MSTLGSLGDFWFDLPAKKRLALVACVAGALVVALVAYGAWTSFQAAQERQAQEQAAQEQAAQEEAERQAEEEAARAEEDGSSQETAPVEVSDVAEHADAGIPVNRLPSECVRFAKDFEEDLKRLADEKFPDSGAVKAELDEARSLADRGDSVAFAVYLADGDGERTNRLLFSYDKQSCSFRLTASYNVAASDAAQAAAAREAQEQGNEANESRTEEVRRQREEQAAREEAEREQDAGSQEDASPSDGAQQSDGTGGTQPGTGGVEAGSGNDGTNGAASSPSGGTSRPALPDPSGDGAWSTGGSHGSAPSGDGEWNTGGDGSWQTGSGSWTTGQ